MYHNIESYLRKIILGVCILSIAYTIALKITHLVRVYTKNEIERVSSSDCFSVSECLIKEEKISELE